MRSVVVNGCKDIEAVVRQTRIGMIDEMEKIVAAACRQAAAEEREACAEIAEEQEQGRQTISCEIRARGV